MDPLNTLEQDILVSIEKGLIPELIKCLNDPLAKSTKLNIVYEAIKRTIITPDNSNAMGILGIILDHGFDINKIDADRLTPIIYTTLNRNTNAMNYLIARGDKIHVKDVVVSFLNYWSHFSNFRSEELFEQFFFVDRYNVIDKFKYIIKQNCEKFMGDCKLGLSCKSRIIHKLFGGYGF